MPPPPHMDGIAHTQTRFVDATRNGGMGWEEARESRDDDGIIFAKPTNGTTRRRRKTLETYSLFHVFHPVSGLRGGERGIRISALTLCSTMDVTASHATNFLELYISVF